MADKNSTTFLQDINDNSANCTIKVQVLLLWNAFYQKTHSKPSSLDMILVDEQGTKIYCSIYSNLISKFESMLEEGGFKVISNFEVKSTKSMFMLANHPYRLCFLDDTVVCDTPAFEIPGDMFEFCSFERINNSTVDKTASFDIIGQVIGNKPIRIMGTKKDQRHILECELRDDKGIVIQCALWDDYGKQLHQYVSANEDSDEPVIILLQLAKFNNWNSKPQVSNCMYGAKLYINENIGPIIEFKESLKQNSPQKETSEQYPKLSSKMIHIKPQDTYLNLPLKSIVELPTIKQPTTCVVIGTITSIITDKGWNYLACRKCSKKVVKLEKTDKQRHVYYECEDCKVVLDVYRRIKLQVMVKDKSGSGPLWIFETAVTKLVKRSASYLINKIKPGDTHHIYPDEFNTILNKTYVFKVEITDFNVKNRYKIYTVFNLSSDTDIIKCVLAQPVTKENAINLDDDSDEDEKDSSTYSTCQTKKRRNNNPSDEASNLKIPKFEKVDSTDENIFKGKKPENGVENLKNPKNQKA